jgi:hypothetical protein
MVRGGKPACLNLFGRSIPLIYGRLHAKENEALFLGEGIPGLGHKVRQTGSSDGDPIPGGGIFPHAGAEIAKTGVEMGFPGAFSRRRKKGLIRPNWRGDLLHIWPLVRGGHKKAVLEGVDPSVGTYDPAHRFLRRRSSRKRIPGDQKYAKNAALLHTFLRWARNAARLPKYARIAAL